MGIRNKRGKLEYRFQIHGRPVQVLTDLADTPSNRRKAAALEAAHRERLQSAIHGRPLAAPCSFSEAVQMFDAANTLNYAQASTARRIATSMVSASLFFGAAPIGTLGAGHIEQYAHWRATEHEVRPITIRHDLHALSLLFQWAVRQGFATHNPVDEVPIPSDRDAIRQYIVSAAEEQLYFAKAKGTLADVARFILLQGMRPAEVLTTRKADVNLAAGTLTVAKSKTAAGRRTLYLLEPSRDIARRRLDSAGPWLFPSPADASKPIAKVNGAHDRLMAATDAEGKRIFARPWCLYDFRHTFATRLKSIGVDDFALAAILGHASPRTLPRYVHPTQHHQDSAMQRWERYLLADEREPNGKKTG